MRLRKPVGATTALLILLAGRPGQARDLEHILQDQGYITEEEYREVNRAQQAEAASAAAPFSFAYKPGKGFTMTTPTGKNALTLGGRVQVRYPATDRDEAADESQFRIRRAPLWVEAHQYDPRFRYGLQGNFADNLELRDAYLEFAPSSRRR